ncbi:MAG: hypothetical protein ACE5EY_07825 [Anaerolineae bacterium]
MFSANWFALHRGGTTAIGAAPANKQLRFVHENGMPLGSGEQVRVLCYTANATGSPVSDLMLKIGSNGIATSPAAENCQYAAALHLLHEQPSGKADHGLAYSVYATSWTPGSSQLSPVSSDIVIRDNEKLVLFNVVASLEWQPEPGSSFTADLRSGLQAASAYLYDITEGQMAFGMVAIYENGRYWNSTDIRFRAANDYRPSAYVGGPTPCLKVS